MHLVSYEDKLYSKLCKIINIFADIRPTRQNIKHKQCEGSSRNQESVFYESSVLFNFQNSHTKKKGKTSNPTRTYVVKEVISVNSPN